MENGNMEPISAYKKSAANFSVEMRRFLKRFDCRLFVNYPALRADICHGVFGVFPYGDPIARFDKF